MRKLVVVVAAGLAVLGLLALMPSPANAELKVGITGNVRLNAVYTDVIAQNGATQEFGPTGVPYTKGPGKIRELDHSQTAIDVRRTRLQAVISDEVGMTKLSAFIQTDFDTSDGNAGTTNSRHLRIRQAWAQGQTPTGWILRFGQQRTMLSEFGDNLFGGVAAPDVVDENGHWDQIQARHPGIWTAYTTKMMGGDVIAGVGVEKAASNVQTTTGLAPTGTVAPNQGTGEDVPLFGAAARLRTPLYAVFVRGGTQKHNVIQTGPSPGADGRKTTAVQGLLGAIGAEVTPGPLTVYAQYAYSDGLNRVIGNFNDVSMAQNTACNPAVAAVGGAAGGFGVSPCPYTGGDPHNPNHLVSITSHNWHTGAEYKLTKDLKGVVVYEWSNAVPNRKIFDLTANSIDKAKFQAVHAGFGYTFWTRFNFGLEYEWGRVNSFGSSVGNVNAVNSRLHFYF